MTRSHALSRCASVLGAELDPLCAQLMPDTVAGATNRFDEPVEIQLRRVRESLDLLVRFLEGDDAFGHLYVGQRIFELYDLERSESENTECMRRSLSRERQLLVDTFAARLSPGDVHAFEETYDRVTSPLQRAAKKRVRTLLVGDCIMSEIVSFLVAQTSREGLSITPFPIDARDPRELASLLSTLADSSYDLIFFSPFTHGRIPQYSQFLDPRTSLISKQRIERSLDDVTSETRRLLDFLVANFDCPIFVHNSGAVHRGESRARIALKNLLCARTRNIAMASVNGWLHDYVAEKHAAGHDRIFVLDEAALVAGRGRVAMGQYLYGASSFQHATRLSQSLSVEYHRRIYTAGRLVGKKVIVCDLDDTLWKGTIGEGAVEPFNDRQQSLKRLKDESGVLLAIASKNSPECVHFDGCVLAAEDFVASEISWDAKANSIRLISRRLNLPLEHFVFVDDRPEERELVRSACPEVHVMDSEDPETWASIALWADLSRGASSLDRTKLYAEREERDLFVGADLLSVAEQRKMLEGLDLSIVTREARKSDLKRVVELINRTNQWNLCGSRTTQKQADAWHADPDARVIVSEVSDRFGKMGIVCAAVVELKENRAELPILVLSCRAFRYGVESAVLAYIAQRFVASNGRTELVGFYKATLRNHVARDMYPEHGFNGEAPEWRWRGEPSIEPPGWAKVSFR